MDQPLPSAPPHRLSRSRTGRLLRIAAVPVLCVVALYLAVLAALWFTQERLLFRPVAIPPSQPLAALAPDVQEHWVDVPGARLSVLELRMPDPKGVVFFLHGNAGNLDRWFVNTDLYRQANFDLVMPDYRGYGRSSGRIESEAQLQADVLAVWQQVAQRYRGKRIVFYGRSLGTGLAATLAAQLQPDLTVLVSPYRSMAALSGEIYPWVPSAVLRYPLRTDQQLPLIRGPVLLMHGDQDTLIPPAHSQALLPLAPHGKLVVVPGAGHGDVHSFDSYRQALLAALAAL